MGEIDILKMWDEDGVDLYQKNSKISTSVIHYGPCCPDEDRLQLLGDLKNKNVLELGCGGAQNSICFAKKGAVVTAVDISPSQLSFAKKLAKKEQVDITFYGANIENLPMIADESQDLVFSAFAFQYVDNLDLCFMEVGRILTSKGLFVFSLDHPFFRIITNKLTVRENYSDTGKGISDYGVYGGLVHARTISQIHNALTRNNFEVITVLEPQDLDCNYWSYMDLYDKEITRIIPPSIIFKVKKK